MIYELAPETPVCVVDNDSNLSRLSSELASFDEVWIVFAKGRMTAAVEQSLFDAVTKDREYRVVSRAKRFAHLKRGEKR